MLSLVQAQSNSVIAPPISVQAQSNQANETQYVSSENDSLADENGFFNDNTVALNLTNIDIVSPATVSLFQLPSINDLSFSGGSTVITYSGNFVSRLYSYYTDATVVTWSLRYLVNGVNTEFIIITGALSLTPSIAINQLVDAINNHLGGSYATYIDSGTEYQIFFTGTPVDCDLIRSNPPSTSTLSLLISGTNTVYAVQLPSSEQGDYDEVSTEFNNGCYELTSVNVYADDIAQANKPFSITDGKANGRTNVKIQNPAILPYQAQFVNECVPIKYFPNPTSELTYTLNAGETVRLIVKYKKNLGCGTSDCFADAEILNEQMHQCNTKPLAEVTTKPLINTMTKPIDNPLISIIKPSKPTIVYTKPTVDIKSPVIDVAKPILPTKPLFKPVLNDTSIVYPKPPMVSPRPIFEKPMPKPMPKPQVIYDEPIQEKPIYKHPIYEKPTPCPIISVINKPTIQPYIAPKPIVLVPVIIKPTIINVIDTCRARRNPRRTNMREYISRFQPSCPMEEVFDYFENSDYKEL
jgi:hypothetical protein